MAPDIAEISRSRAESETSLESLSFGGANNPTSVDVRILANQATNQTTELSQVAKRISELQKADETASQGTEGTIQTIPAILQVDSNTASPKKSSKKSINLLCCLKPGAQTESDPPTPKNIESAFREAAESIATAAADSPAVISAAVEGGKSIAKAAVSSVK